MDARFDPAKALGLEEGDAHVIKMQEEGLQMMYWSLVFP